MEKNSNSDNIHSLPVQLGVLVEETLGKALLQDVDISKGLTKDIAARLSNYNENLFSSIEQKSITRLLFESFDTTIDIQKKLDRYIQDAGQKVFEKELNKLNLESIQLLKIEVKDKTIEKKSPITFSGKLQERISKSLKSVLKKTPLNKKVTECYQYFHLILNTLQNHRNKFEDFEKKRLEILLELWEKSKIIETNIDILAKNKYDLDVSQSEFNLDINFDNIIKLDQEFAEEANALIISFKDQIKSAFENLENEKQIHQENIEKNKRKYNGAHVFKASIAIENEYERSREKWQNTLLALSDDMELDLEISSLKFQILNGYFSFLNFVDITLKNPLDEKMNAIVDFTEELLLLFKPTESGYQNDIISTIKKSKLDFRRKLVLRLVPEIKTILLNSELPKEVDEFEKNTSKQFETLSKSRLLIKNPVYDHSIDRSEMQKISPYDLVSFDMQPEFMEVFPSLKNSIIRHLQFLQEKLDEIPEIVDYSIESAIGYYEEKKDLPAALKIGSEGIKRAANKIEDLSALRRDFYASEVDFTKDKIDQLFTKISEITDNENALQIKIRVTKGKAIEQSKALREKIVRKIKNFLPLIIDKIRIFNKFLIESSIKLRKQFEGEVAKEFISSDVSDYLAETEEAVSRLPFVYQRLFKLEPLSTFDLYIERPQAHQKFKLAYSRWESGKFAPTVISGEKGSGKTSFINHFLASKSIHEKIIFHDLHKEYLEPEVAYNKLYESIKDLLTGQNEENPDKPRRVVVIDGLERLFEARINGFNVLQKTMQLISKTNDQIFWIFACHLYSYKYLQRSFNIAEYFGYHIELEDLLADDLIEMIEKRHNISGFRLNFLPDAQKKSLIPKMKQTDKSDQMELRNVYFERLQKIVRGNITQAFLYWMRSAAEVTEDIIYINSQGDTKLDFIRSISLSKFEILKNILIHNGISSAKHSKLFRIPFEKSELQLEQMLDDGIIIKRSEFYNINPMIYKQVIDQMYKLNLLH